MNPIVGNVVFGSAPVRVEWLEGTAADTLSRIRRMLGLRRGDDPLPALWRLIEAADLAEFAAAPLMAGAEVESLLDDPCFNNRLRRKKRRTVCQHETKPKPKP